MLRDIEYFSVLHHLGVSDHECLSVSFKTNGFHVNEVQKVNVLKNESIVYSNKKDFLMKLRSPLGREKLTGFLENYIKCDEASIEPMCSDLVNILKGFSENMNSSKRKHERNYGKKKNKDRRPWYTNAGLEITWKLLVDTMSPSRYFSGDIDPEFLLP